MAITPSGRFVLFSSKASDLVANDTNGARDVFVRDLTTGTTTLVSVNNARGASGNGDSFAVAITPDGRFVLFESFASTLVACLPGRPSVRCVNDSNNAYDVFVRDLTTGTTTLVSIDRGGTASGNGGSDATAITPDGRFVLFWSSASNLVANANPIQVFVRDLTTGTTTLVSSNSAGTAGGDFLSIATAITPDGRFVLFDSYATDLVANDTNGQPDVFVRELP